MSLTARGALHTLGAPDACTGLPSQPGLSRLRGRLGLFASLCSVGTRNGFPSPAFLLPKGS